MVPSLPTHGEGPTLTEYIQIFLQSFFSPTPICFENISLCQTRPRFLLANLQRGRLISLGEAAVFLHSCCCLSVCFKLRIKMPGSAGFRRASSLLSAHFNPTDFSSGFFHSRSFSLSLSLSLSLSPLFHFTSIVLGPLLSSITLSLPPTKNPPPPPPPALHHLSLS